MSSDDDIAKGKICEAVQNHFVKCPYLFHKDYECSTERSVSETSTICTTLLRCLVVLLEENHRE